MLHLSTEFCLEFSEDETRDNHNLYEDLRCAKESTAYLKLIHRFGTIAFSTIYIIYLFYLLIIQRGNYVSYCAASGRSVS